MSDTPIPNQPWTPIRLNAQYHVISYEDAVLQSLLTQAAATSNRMFCLYRDRRFKVRKAPAAVLDAIGVGLQSQCLRVDAGTLVVRGTDVFAQIHAFGTAERCTVVVKLWASSEGALETAIACIHAPLEAVEIADVAFTLNWRFLDGRGGIQRATTEERSSDPLLTEAYPTLGSVEDFIAAYLDGNESVLVLQGPPGTGKTRLIRAILAAISRRRGRTAEVIYTGDADVLDRDEVFLEFITEDHDAFVVEDADHLLRSRVQGNQALHRFLNIADGVASAHGKKIIFSTNLPSVRDIDDALIRPGRCFAHVLLPELGILEARGLLERLSKLSGIPVDPAWNRLGGSTRKTASLAEVYAAHRAHTAQIQKHQGLQSHVRSATDRVSFGFS